MNTARVLELIEIVDECDAAEYVPESRGWSDLKLMIDEFKEAMGHLRFCYAQSSADTLAELAILGKAWDFLKRYEGLNDD